MDWCDLFTHILQGYFIGTGTIVLGQSYNSPGAPFTNMF